ncbi:MAG TPA: acyl-CoA thioesterase [Gemmatimonadales bacterium]|nr:acyl-CoA thioesterase [Gemmatimonadales bacterium]
MTAGTRPRIYIKRLVIPPDAMDRQGHVNNLAYVAWMQDVAIEHSTAAGWPMERYLALGAGWVVRSHFVEYLRPAVAGQRMAIYTWVPEFTQRSTPRRYFFVREDDRQLVARAETRWVFVDLASGRRRPLPDDLLAAFVSVPDEAEVRRLAGVEP